MQFIRVDANKIIASGHVMRCMAIAKQMQKLGEQVVFLLADDFAAEMVINNGFEAEILGTKWDDMESEVPTLRRVINKYVVDRPRMLVDSYKVTPLYFEMLKEFASVYYMDDGMKDTYSVDGIIAYLHYYKMFGIEERYSNRMLLGTDYLPLREEFSGIGNKLIADKIKKVMITTGGADAIGSSQVIEERLCKVYPDIEFHFIVGRFFTEEQYGKLIQNKLPNTFFHKNAIMSDWMKECDVAISAGGTTLYEMCACRIPTICFSVADNQILTVETLAEMGIMLGCGRANEISEDEFIDNLLNNFEKIQSADLRKELSAKMGKLVDGQGARRIAENLIKN